MADELKPCPFCGGNNVSTFGPYGWNRNWGISHSCKSFYSGSQEIFQGFATEAEAITAWNTRTETQSQAAIDELVGALELYGLHLGSCKVTHAKSDELLLTECTCGLRTILSRHKGEGE